ncbi:transposase [Clostridium tyrobutyricum]|uniref:transposase n=1 Tax=Clostridium tyrobutyricum TaxID=1519 RepID=UPI001C381C57|nr:transposase [Clostridium tyrobutyricum]MBV4423265.1 transposase [Clostridium tyrobutyricum]
MVRKIREWYPGAKYHIICRGNHRDDLFRDEQDYKVYLNILKETKKKLIYEIYCYCLMTNHIHMVIATEEIRIGNIMKRINMCYSIYFNKKYNLTGHLFQDRYKSQLIKEDKHMLEVSRYIHLNPVKANMVKNPEDYEWSSYNMIIGMHREKFISSQRILDYFNNSRQLYQKFVERM